jgi:hypothetical protein
LYDNLVIIPKFGVPQAQKIKLKVPNLLVVIQPYHNNGCKKFINSFLNSKILLVFEKLLKKISKLFFG